MSVMSAIIGTAERVPLPDVVIRAAIQRLCSRTATRLSALGAADDAAFAGRMMLRPIVGEADAGHDEVPASFFAQVLGPNLKYSSCFYKSDATTLQEAEEEALRQTVEHAGLADGQTVLELGCGWGSLSLWMARQFPHAKITAVSNSQGRRAYVEEQARLRGLPNLRVITADMNVFAPDGQFDRIVSIEMFEQIMNWRKLMTRLRSWLAPEGRFFMHIVTHRCGSPVRPDRSRGLDCAAHLHGRVDAEPSPRQAVRRHLRDREGMVLERHALPAHGERLARQFRRASRYDRGIPAQGLWRGDRTMDAALALVPARDIQPVRLCRWNGVGRQPVPPEARRVIAMFRRSAR